VAPRPPATLGCSGARGRRRWAGCPRGRPACTAGLERCVSCLETAIPEGHPEVIVLFEAADRRGLAGRGSHGLGLAASRARPVARVQDDVFDATASITVCVFSIDSTDAPLDVVVSWSARRESRRPPTDEETRAGPPRRPRGSAGCRSGGAAPRRGPTGPAAGGGGWGGRGSSPGTGGTSPRGRGRGAASPGGRHLPLEVLAVEPGQPGQEHHRRDEPRHDQAQPPGRRAIRAVRRVPRRGGSSRGGSRLERLATTQPNT